MTEDAVAFWVSSASDYGVILGTVSMLKFKKGNPFFATKKALKSNPSRHRSNLSVSSVTSFFSWCHCKFQAWMNNDPCGYDPPSVFLVLP